MTAQPAPIEAYEWGKTVIQLFGPILALTGAIFLYFLKARDDREASARQSRSKLYEEYIDKISAVLRESTELPVSAAAIKLAIELAPIHSKITIVAPPAIVKASHTYLKSLVSVEGTSFWRPPSELTDAVERLAHIEKNRQLGNARQQLVNAFRRDIYPGAEPLPNEMLVADQPGDSILNQFASLVERRTAEIKS